MRGRGILSSRWKAALLALGLLASLALPSAARADAVVEMVKPFTFTEANPCTGEPVTVTGHNHIVLHFRTDASGGVHITIALDERGSGFNLLNPEEKYTVADRQFAELNAPQPAAEITTDFRTRVVRAGEVDSPEDFFLRTRLHMTFNGKGEPTASFFSGPTVECR